MPGLDRLTIMVPVADLPSLAVAWFNDMVRGGGIGLGRGTYE